MLISDRFYDDAAEIHDIDLPNIFVHPKFELPTLKHDIALLKTNSPVSFNEFIQPATIPSKSFEDLTNKEIVAAGYGLESLNDKRQMVSLTYLENVITVADLCRVRTDKARFCAMIITKDGKTPAACFGDSGGGCYRKDKDVNSLIGVSSAVSGSNCTGSNTFMRISYYRSWIESVSGV